MKMPTDYAKASAASTGAIPRQVIAGLLERLLPRVPVARRPAEPAAPLVQSADGRISPAFESAPSAFARVKAKVKRRAPRKAGNRYYEIVVPTGYRNHRAGTWRHAMVASILSSTNEADALARLTENYPEFASKGLDLNWVATNAGYVRFI